MIEADVAIAGAEKYRPARRVDAEEVDRA